jgi:S-adenosylmethionine:tRNA ribosyltransferase-isomerase
MTDFVKDYNFFLPPELIANQPFFPKEETKLLVADGKNILDRQIINLVDFLESGDLLVFNDAKVIKAKLTAINLRNSANIEFNLDQEINSSNNKNTIWQALCKPAKKINNNDQLKIADDFYAEILQKKEDGFLEVNFPYLKEEFFTKLEKYGRTPLPPYIKRSPIDFEQEKIDQQNYQTIYAKNSGAVAAPTAGLHFNKNIFSLIEKKQVNHIFITLNVGAGTFLPLRSNLLSEHKMHQESFIIDKEAAEIINQTKAQKKRVIAVGTTSLRALESSLDKEGKIVPTTKLTRQNTDIFIYPPYNFRSVDMLITNFHLPKSTLFMLVSAFIGKKHALEVYYHAINNKYRFYSYGDASLLFKNSF